MSEDEAKKEDTPKADEPKKEDEPKTDKTKAKYQVILVEKAPAPEGLPGDNWHRYVIGEGGSKIEGLKPGSLKAVTEHAKFAAEELNSRSAKGRSTYAPVKRVDPKRVDPKRVDPNQADPKQADPKQADPKK